MNIIDLGPVIATRTLASGDRTISVSIGQPFVPPDFDGNWCCPYRIEGLGGGAIRYAGGVDAVQALWMALLMIGTDLYTSAPGIAGRISWLGMRNLGFPVPEAVRDLVPE